MGNRHAPKKWKCWNFRSRKSDSESWPSPTPKQKSSGNILHAEAQLQDHEFSSTRILRVHQAQQIRNRPSRIISQAKGLKSGGGSKYWAKSGRQRLFGDMFQTVSASLYYSDSFSCSTTPEIICQPDMQWFMIVFSILSHSNVSRLWFVLRIQKALSVKPHESTILPNDSRLRQLTNCSHVPIKQLYDS